MSLNAQGQNIPEKRSRLLADLHAHRAQVAFIQETHFQTYKVQKLSDYRFPHVFHAACLSSKSKGVAILFSKNFPFQVDDSIFHSGGRFVILKGTGGGRKLTFVNIYCPNVGHVAFLHRVCNHLSQCTTGTFNFGGESQCPPDTCSGFFHGLHVCPVQGLEAMKLDLQSLMLHDTWRTMNPSQ